MTYKRRDNKHVAIRNGLADAGIYTMDMANLGFGKPDLLAVRKNKSVILLEVKTHGETLTPAEKKFFDEYPGEIAIVETVEDAIKATL